MFILNKVKVLLVLNHKGNRFVVWKPFIFEIISLLSHWHLEHRFNDAYITCSDLGGIRQKKFLK
ncbi:hypothetical protein PAECIP111890_01719 [Paenibacillus sp. JJ-223]|nr:hypothetical protein PAECIP111890_01719 [Paenibacillus sp. JJ-223]